MFTFRSFIPPIFRFKHIIIFAWGLCFVSLLNAQTFTDITQTINPAFSNNPVNGASAADFNNDGLVDIYIWGRLYENRGENGFADVLPQSGITEGATIFGAVFGDYDNDGYLDIVMEDFSAPSILFRNNQSGRFSPVNASTNLSVLKLAQGAGWADFDRNGTLDLFVNNDAGNNQLFRNDNFQTFTDISASAGTAASGNSYGMSWGDYNNDGYPDIFIAPCGLPENSIKHLLKNNRDGTFTDVNVEAGVADSSSSWGVTWLDFNNDGNWDIYIANWGFDLSDRGKNRLYQNNGDGTFTSVADSAGVSGDPLAASIGVAAADFDNDGWIDIYVTDNENRHKLYRNNGGATGTGVTFTDVAQDAGIAENRHGTVAVADFNNDGWMDIFTAGFNVRLMQNTGGDNNWIIITPRGTVSNHFGVGTRLELYAGGMQQIREIRAGDSFCSQSDQLRAHFGLGSAALIDSLVLRWPSGMVQKLEGLAPNQFLIVREDSAAVGIEDGAENLVPQEFSLAQNFPNPFNPSTTIEYALPTASSVKLSVYNMLGQEIKTLINEFQPAGKNSVAWDGKSNHGVDVPSGIYLYRIEAGNFVETKKMILIR